MNDFTCILHGKGDNGTFSCDIGEELYFGGGYEVCVKDLIIPTSWFNVRANYNWIFVDDTLNNIKRFIHVKPGRYSTYSELLFVINQALIEGSKPNCDLFFYYHYDSYHHQRWYLPTPAGSRYRYPSQEYTYQRSYPSRVSSVTFDINAYQKFPSGSPSLAVGEVKGKPQDWIVFGCGGGTTLNLIFCPQIAILLNLIDRLDVGVPMIRPGWQVLSDMSQWMTNVNRLNVRMLWLLADFIYPTMVGDSQANLLQTLSFNISERPITHYTFANQNFVRVQGRRIQRFGFRFQENPLNDEPFRMKGEITIVLCFRQR
jgi:hypothetical protein